MRRFRELLTATGVLVSALAVVLLAAPSALAGGPTSVLLVSPESAESAALYHSDEEYGELMRLLGGADSDSREVELPGLGAADGHQLNVTWMAHDVSPWRVDRVYPDASWSKDVWIHTTTDVTTMEGYWHKARQPAEVRTLLKKLGILGRPRAQGAGGIRPGPRQTPEGTSAGPTPTPTSTSTSTARSRTRTAAATGDGTDWWWAIPGAAAGAVLARIRRPHKGEPRQELRDV
ncbi:hypothetical protein ABT040_37105 [Streptomyces sp. NPDC002688]|uniref:hypothetical protein n=1 Tax=Streptomyces sp. NPDC002688 TaxID=3154423 RepID=UPI0033164CDA